VQQRGGERDPAGSAHQEDRRQLGRRQAGRRHRQQGRRDGAVEDRAGQSFELLAAQRDAVVDQGDVHVRGRGAAQGLLGLPGVLPELPRGATVGVVGGL
jgi:hypothetical protein